MPTVITQGAASAKGYGFGARATAANYIEDVFSTYLYTGNGSTQTITNGIDLAGKGGLVWIKNRGAVANHLAFWYDGSAYPWLSTNTTAAAGSLGSGNQFNANGFSLNASSSLLNASSNTYASWTFREQAKFFDVVTYTGDGSASPRQIAHSLGSVPGFIVIKRTDTTSDWTVWHRSVTGNAFLQTTDAWQTGFTRITTPDASTFTVGASTAVNASGGTYVAYLFAHDAGGFGASGSDNVISCGSVSGAPNSTQTVNLGWEPQWILWKPSDDVRNWVISDNMRGLTADGTGSATLAPNLSDAESTSSRVAINATGFTMSMLGTPNPTTSIYIAIRRGPMKTPTSGTSVFGLSARNGSNNNATVTGGQTDDAVLIKNRGSAVGDLFAARLTGTGYMETSSTAAEVAAGTTILQANPWDVMDGVKVGSGSQITNGYAQTYINYLFRRAPGFFDVVCYTGTGTSGQTYSHNLGIVPELMFVKRRSAADSWFVYSAALGNTKRLRLNADSSSVTDSAAWNNTTPTSTQFTVGNNSEVNAASSTYVAYLFATVAGVSKVGSYTGTATTLQIDCGFTGGARFVMIKRTDSSGPWVVWDSARGIVAGNDPYLLLNTTDAEVTNTDYVDTYSAGFEISSTAPAAINANGGSFIFLAIA